MEILQQVRRSSQRPQQAYESVLTQVETPSGFRSPSRPYLLFIARQSRNHKEQRS